MQVGRAARDGSQGACVVLAPKGTRKSKALGKLLSQQACKKAECLVEGLAQLFTLTDSDGIPIRLPSTCGRIANLDSTDFLCCLLLE